MSDDKNNPPPNFPARSDVNFNRSALKRRYAVFSDSSKYSAPPNMAMCIDRCMDKYLDMSIRKHIEAVQEHSTIAAGFVGFKEQVSHVATNIGVSHYGACMHVCAVTPKRVVVQLKLALHRNDGAADEGARTVLKDRVINRGLCLKNVKCTGGALYLELSENTAYRRFNADRLKFTSNRAGKFGGGLFLSSLIRPQGSLGFSGIDDAMVLRTCSWQKNSATIGGGIAAKASAFVMGSQSKH